MTGMDMREYQRLVALFCLGAAGACTAAELLEQMGIAAMGAGHPPEFLPSSAPAVAGLLRELQGSGHVIRGEDRYDTRHGRQVAVWSAADPGAVLALPAAPRGSGRNADAPPAPVAFRTITVDQRLAFLEIEFEDWIQTQEKAHRAAQERHREEFVSFMKRARRLVATTEVPACS
ncbi:hypothetical protein ARC78_15120 [Stenotrophomonas pictorum JCM 9942]|uniref:Uncharacterized protein n=1 Tax=Stenotrophomonas pictorum JCM 9942 TaxID=1236960 RepID=A0A0R0ABN1_9GAMM|nr:helix-turn-helix domain-containing protein [Stenotrophomonas pictorum]KRG38868.1 hypothetical protein ARC78_15120 [Stenotrophomonas pictorum JCM 9942]